jgi:hypothetical protein
MNFYSAPEFIDTLVGVYGLDKTVKPRAFTAESKVWLLPATDDGTPQTEFPFIDYFEPLAVIPGATVGDYPALRHLRRAALTTVDRETWFAQRLFQSYAAAPLIEWGQFPEWEDFQAAVRRYGGQYWRDSRRRLNKLHRAAGPSEFRWHDPDPATFAACLQWKSGQFDGIRRMFADLRHRRLFETLAERGFLTISSLMAGGRPVAVVLGVVWQGCYSYWIPSYDPARADCSPGRLLLEAIMAESHRLGHHRFDFLLGAEGYKWLYATHTQLIGEIAGWRGPCRRWLKRVLYPLRRPLQIQNAAFGVRQDSV